MAPRKRVTRPKECNCFGNTGKVCAECKKPKAKRKPHTINTKLLELLKGGQRCVGSAYGFVSSFRIHDSYCPSISRLS